MKYEDQRGIFFNKTKEKAPRPFLVKAIQFVQKRDNALDLGAGALNESAFLLEQGFQHVTAVDEVVVDSERAKAFPQGKFNYAIKPMQEFPFPENTYDLVSAQYSLPFIPPEEFGTIIHKIIESLKEGGIFAGQLFGLDDCRNKEGTKMTFHSEEDVKKLFENLEIIQIEKKKHKATDGMGQIGDYEIFFILARK